MGRNWRDSLENAIKMAVFKNPLPPPSWNVDFNLIRFIIKSLFMGPWTNHLDKIIVKSPQLIIWPKSITSFVKSSQTNHRLITIYFILQVFSGRHGNNQINYYVQKKLSKTCRQFASLIVFLRGSIVSRGITSQKIRQMTLVLTNIFVNLPLRVEVPISLIAPALREDPEDWPLLRYFAKCTPCPLARKWYMTEGSNVMVCCRA